MAKGRPYVAGLQKTGAKRWVEVTREAVSGCQDVQYNAVHPGSGTAHLWVVASRKLTALPSHHFTAKAGQRHHCVVGFEDMPLATVLTVTAQGSEVTWC